MYILMGTRLGNYPGLIPDAEWGKSYYRGRYKSYHRDPSLHFPLGVLGLGFGDVHGITG